MNEEKDLVDYYGVLMRPDSANAFQGQIHDSMELFTVQEEGSSQIIELCLDGAELCCHL